MILSGSDGDLKGTFVFHGVGQGLYYSGEIKSNKEAINFIYDCGTATHDKLNAITKSVPKKIDFAVISHFHEDHINGFVKLLQEKKHEIKKIYIPYFGESEDHLFIIKVFAWCYIEEPNAKDLFLSFYDTGYQNNADITNVRNKVVFIKEGTSYKRIITGWVFRFFNKSHSTDEIQKLCKSIRGLMAPSTTVEEYLSSKHEDIAVRMNKIKKEFEKCFGNNINPSSLMLLHYPTRDNTMKTLLTGDIEFDSTLSDSVHKYCIKNNTFSLDVLQAPHHGSWKSWNKMSDNLKYESNHVVFSFGLNNTYGHPKYKCILDRNTYRRLRKNIHYVHDDYEGKEYNYSYSIEL